MKSTYEPSQAEIRESCLLIQSEWTPETEMSWRAEAYQDKLTNIYVKVGT